MTSLSEYEDRGAALHEGAIFVVRYFTIIEDCYLVFMCFLMLHYKLFFSCSANKSCVCDKHLLTIEYRFQYVAMFVEIDMRLCYSIVSYSYSI